MSTHRTSLRSLLLRRFNWIEERVVDDGRRHGYEAVTPAMARLFGNMAGQPVGLSELARRMGVSRQAIHKLASEASRLGLVEFVVDPRDARVMRLQFTREGWAMSAQAAKDFEELEAGLRQHLGARNLAELKRLLQLPWDAGEASASGQKQEVD